MSSIITALFEAAVGWLVNKGRDHRPLSELCRDVAAERLKEDQKFRSLIVREMEDIKSKLDASSRKDLGAAVNSFETGIRHLYEAIDAKRSGDASTITAQATESIKEENFNEFSSPSPTDALKTVALAMGIKNMQLTEFDDTTENAVSEAKKRFEMAREKATEASNNEALSTTDRITAIRYRVMATMLESAAETVVTAGDLSSQSAVKSTLKRALPECLQKLHSLPDVQKSFKVELEKGLLNIKGRFGKDERREIISTVCQVNRAIYDVMRTVGDSHVWVWPCVDTGEDKVDPLRDERVKKVLRKVGMEHCCVRPWSFGQREDEEEHNLKKPRGITTIPDGQFLIADDGDKTVKVFYSNGNFHRSFNPQTDDPDTKLDILDVATDVENNTYVLVSLKKPGAEGCEREVVVFNNTADLQRHKFPVKGGDWDRLTVSGSKVLVSEGKDVVDVYQQDGVFVRSFGEGLFKGATDITAANDGRVMVLDRDDSCVHLFTVEGQQLSKFNINIKGDYYDHIACHPAGEHVVVVGYERKTGHLRVAIFTTNGEFVRRIELDDETVHLFGAGITVTMEGQIAVAFTDVFDIGVVVVV